MKNFFDKIFKPYIFPFVILIVGVYLKAGENLNSVTSFFRDNTSGFINFFNNQLYLWEILLYLTLAFVLVKLFKGFFKNKTTKQKAMLRAIKRVPNQFPVNITGTTNKYLFKYDLDVEDEEYQINNLRPYCQNCTPNPLRMSEYGYGDYRCNCGKEIDYHLCQDVESRIITALEENES